MRCTPGKVAVEMAPTSEMVGSLYIPDNMQLTGRVDVGRVVGVGGNPHEDDDASADPSEELKEGDLVVVDNDAGIAIPNCYTRTADYPTEVRIYGTAGGHLADMQDVGDCEEAVTHDFDLAVLAKYEGKTLVPLGRNVLVHCPESDGKIGSILVTDRVKEREGVCTVVSRGPRCSDHVKEGQQYFFHQGALRHHWIEGTDLFIFREDFLVAEA